MSWNPLPADLRKSLSDAVREGRATAESGAAEALKALGVASAEAPPKATAAERALRNQLRAHARQLGDPLEKQPANPCARLEEAIAYEQWHRVLFTRFLVENGLLIHPESQGPISLELCEELAADEGKSTWELASEFASAMLPEIFRPEDPTQRIRLPRNRLQSLQDLVVGLDQQVFKASDSLGWAYQYWQARKKAEIGQSTHPVGANEIPAVTQLFTEDYMVEFLLHNSLGAWWHSRQAGKKPPVDLPYLRLLEPEQGTGEESSDADEADAADAVDAPVAVAAAGEFASWPSDLSQFKAVDPCCGSGHFLVFLLLILVPMRQELEALSAQDAVDAVIRDNLYGLELDPRCVEIAVFAVALAAWTYPGASGYRVLPRPHIACCGLPVTQSESMWLELAGSDEALQAGMQALHRAFREAPTLGSLIDPHSAAGSDLLTAQFSQIQPLLETALRRERAAAAEEASEVLLTASGLLQAAKILAGQYDLVATNTPYLGFGYFDSILKSYIEANYPSAKQDLANVMLERCLKLCKPGGVVQFVMPQNWLYQVGYLQHRKELLRTTTWSLLGLLNERAFASPQAAGAFVILVTLTKETPAEGHLVRGIDATGPNRPEGKAEVLRNGPVVSVTQASQLSNPESKVTLTEIGSTVLMNRYAKSHQGIKTGDDYRNRALFWEVEVDNVHWRLMQSTVLDTCHYGGMESVVRWTGQGALLARKRGVGAWGQRGVMVSQMRGLPVALYRGEVFDSNASPITPVNKDHLPALWAMCSSPEYAVEVRKIDRALKPTNASLVQVPFDLAKWSQVAAQQFPNGLPLPEADDPTQWVFHGHPRYSTHPLQVAVARLLGFHWPAQQNAAIEVSPLARKRMEEGEALDGLSDTDGIVCLPPVNGESPAADRLVAVLERAYGNEWSPGLMDTLLKNAGYAGRTLEDWLQNGFFAEHCKLFKDAPFLWHIWDGEAKGFSAVVNYRKLSRQGLSALTFTYLGTWIDEQERMARQGSSGAGPLAAAAKALQARLKAILEGEAPLDIFVRWKSLSELPLGWDPDLSDTVRSNIRPFLLAGDVARKGAGVLRHRPAITWGPNKGADSADAPWAHLGPTYGLKPGIRINDHHTTLADKRKARGQ